MFVLAEMRDTVKIHPKSFKHKINTCISEELNRKLANKVFLNVGLCIALNDILEIGESFIFADDGSSHTKVRFRYVIFRPFMEEIIVGKIRSCNSEGVHVTLGFFEDILIPPHKLQYPSRFDQTEQVWVWEYDDGEKHDLFMDVGEIIRFRVVKETFVDSLPNTPGESGEKTEPLVSSPYVLEAAIDEPGLGLLSWWNN
ncbi:DNA-directed RNA polymerase III subunit RPC8 [Copidosoma floridanum]|uniref:DNA-directed RNA polymerase III subunit RPC8 n=1 Tax=Copidosoma floridanum TaxID=29053 RepID=UPI0006C9B859|nr:DNA-directed RNA polymerase III subunit RPC8 [Copidosoma floridanum]